GELIEDRAEFRPFADQLVVVELLELGVALADEAVPDRVPEQRAFRVAPDVAEAVAVPLGDGAGDHGAVGGDDPAAADLLLLEQGPGVGVLFLQRLGIEHRPIGSEPDQDREEDDDEGEEFDDLSVHAFASRRARSEIRSSSARRTKLATTELPP